MTSTTAEAVQLYSGSMSTGGYSSSSLCDAAIVEAANNINTKRCTKVKKLATQKRKAYFLCCSRLKKRRKAAAVVNRTHLGNLILRRVVLLLEARKRFLAHRLKHIAATVDTVRSELQPVKEETKRALDQLLSIKRNNDNNNTSRIVNGSLEEKLKSLLERCAGKEEEVLNTTKAIREKMQEIWP